MKFLPYLFLAGVLAAATPGASQIVNIEARRLHTDSVRFAGRANASFSYSENNARRLYVVNGDFVVQLKSRNLRSIWLLLGNQNFSRAGGQNFSDATLGHIRYNFKQNRWVRWEAFQQLQRNGVLGIGLRSLTGAGPRFKLADRRQAHVYLGTLYMYEAEKSRVGDLDVRERHHRLSSYLSFTLDFKGAANATLISTTYYQPVLNRHTDYRLLTENRLDVRLWRKLSFFTNFRYLFDSRPPEGIRRYATALEQGIGVTF